MTVLLDGFSLKIRDVVNIARNGEQVELSPDALARVRKCRALLESKIAEGEIMYGVNTGIGEFSEIALSEHQVKDFQRYLIFNHSAGIGKPMPVDYVRAAMVSRINVHLHGNSGCRSEIPETMAMMLNRGVTPVVCEKGSVGACGDLAPMSQVALLLLGEGEAWYRGERMPGREAMERAGIPIPGLQARDGLALINGSNFIAGIGALFVNDIEMLLTQAEIAAAMSLEALLANMLPYQRKLHELRGFPGSIASAENIRNMIDGSDLVTGKMPVKVQDAYSMRATPQIIGTARDQLTHTARQFEIELNGVMDNPIFLPDEDRVLTGANFQGTPIALPLDCLGSALCMICALSERRLNRLENHFLNAELPPFLTDNPGLFSGLMLSQYTAGMLVVEQKILSTPSFIQSIPAAADQEDFVSMGMNAVLKTRQIIENACGIIGIELMAAAQALDYRKFSFGRGTKAAYDAVRSIVKHLDTDRPLFIDHNKMAAMVASNSLISEVEKAGVRFEHSF